MTYNKPQIVSLGSSLKVIHGSVAGKPETDQIDNNINPSFPTTSLNAYEADE
jgi:hypothetical protein